MITASIFSQKIEGVTIYGLSLHNDENHMQIHCGQDLEKVIIMYEELTQKPAITNELLNLKIA